MKGILFSPLRRIKKTGKISVYNYLLWRKVKTLSNHSVFFDMAINDEYKNFNDSEFVYNHKGEQLFWYDHKNPELLSRPYISIEQISDILKIDIEDLKGEEYKISHPIGSGFHWDVKGFDCDGVPVFSHNNADYIATHYENMDDFIPLTVGMVKLWFGWFLWQLDNVKIV